MKATSFSSEGESVCDYRYQLGVGSFSKNGFTDLFEVVAVVSLGYVPVYYQGLPQTSRRKNLIPNTPRQRPHQGLVVPLTTSGFVDGPTRVDEQEPQVSADTDKDLKAYTRKYESSLRPRTQTRGFHFSRPEVTKT